jgi:5-methylcytosine-specific restriction enzyme subunit McrC
MLILKTREHESILVPGDLIFREGRLHVFPDIKGEKFFKITLRHRGVELQAAGYIGFIPLNNAIAIEVAPRIPVANVEYLLARSGLTPAVTLPYVRQFDEAHEDAAPFLQLLAMRLDALLHELKYEGVLKTYVRRRHVGSNPSGRILPLETMLSSRSKGRAVAHFEQFDRTIDNPVNRLILAAGRKVLRSKVFREGAANQKLAQSISAGLLSLRGVDSMTEPEHVGLEDVPSHRPFLRQLVSVSSVILRELGVRLRSEGQLSLPTFLIKMDDVFEAYVRKALQESTELNGLGVQDGNQQPPSGAAKRLFEKEGPLGNRDATPDIVIGQDSKLISVIEVKYKPCPKQPERDNLNQVLTYALAYNVKHAVLLYPATDGQSTELTKLGVVQGVECYKATIDLSVRSIREEEGMLAGLIRKSLFATEPTGP